MLNILTNIAPGCHCRQSSIDAASQIHTDGASRATIGSRNGDATFVTLREPEPWWEIDLGRTVNLAALVVYNWDKVGVHYAEAGRSRTRFLQVWGSSTGDNWQLLHDRRDGNRVVNDFGGIHHGPLFLDIQHDNIRFIKLTLAGGGVLQLDWVQVFGELPSEIDGAVQQLVSYTNDLNFGVARKITAALLTTLTPTKLVAKITQQECKLTRYGVLFFTNLLLEAGRAPDAEQLLATTFTTRPLRTVLDSPALARLPNGTLCDIVIAPYGDDYARKLLHVPAIQLPLRIALGQRLEEIALGAAILSYVLAGAEVYIQRQRCSIPGGPVLQTAIEAIFTRHPGVELIIIQSVLEESSIIGYSERQVARHTFVLDLPHDFQDYRSRLISKNLRSEIERNRRGLTAVLPGTRFEVLSGETLERAKFEQAVKLIEKRLESKVEATEGAHSEQAVFSANEALDQWDTYQRCGEVVLLADDEHMFAAAICLHFEQDCFFMAAGHLDVAPRHGLGKMLLYRLIEDLIRRGVKRLHLGGGDFGYKGRFGAIEQALYTYHFTRQVAAPMQTRLQQAFIVGERPALLETDLATPLESILGASFEATLGVDFDTIVENVTLGTNGLSRRYQPTMRDPFLLMMQHVPRQEGDVFVDVGCGKGKMLYYAAQLGYTKCIGIEIAALLLEQAKVNLERMQLPASITLMQRDATNIAPEDLGQANVFYLFNPFSDEIMTGFLQCLIRSQEAHPRRVLVLYCNSQFEAPFAPLGFKPIKIFADGEKDWRFGRSVIFGRDPR